MEVSLEISIDAARALRQMTSENKASLQLLATAKQLGVTLQPMHPGINDPDLAKSYFVEVATEAEAELAIDSFLNCPAVEGAYAKPEGEAP